MPRAKQPRRAPLGVVERSTSHTGTNERQKRPAASDRRELQGLSAEDAELLVTVLRELKKGNFSIRMPLATNGVMARIGTEINDIIELNERNAKSQILFAEAQEASKSKSAFLSMAAHELRTPLSVITGYISMLQDGSLPPDKFERPLKVLMSKATELNSIVDDLLTAARIEGGTVPTEAKTLDLREMARQAIARAEARAGLLKADMAYEEPPEPVPVTADREQLARIIDNLVNNALTYASGAPWLKLTVTSEDGPRLIVEDHGIGIPRDKQEKVFERFYRIDDPGLGPLPGTGLGLFISRELAERHGGSLVLEHSAPGKGSTFVLRLPVAVPAHGPGLSPAVATPEGIPASQAI